MMAVKKTTKKVAKVVAPKKAATKKAATKKAATKKATRRAPSKPPRERPGEMRDRALVDCRNEIYRVKSKDVHIGSDVIDHWTGWYFSKFDRAIRKHACDWDTDKGKVLARLKKLVEAAERRARLADNRVTPLIALKASEETDCGRRHPHILDIWCSDAAAKKTVRASPRPRR
jgi:hypothetical protein